MPRSNRRYLLGLLALVALPIVSSAPGAQAPPVHVWCPPDTTLIWHPGLVVIYAMDNADTVAWQVKYHVANDRNWYGTRVGEATLGAGERAIIGVSMADTALVPPLRVALSVWTMDSALLDSCSNAISLLSRVRAVFAQADTDRVRVAWELRDSTVLQAHVVRTHRDTAAFVGDVARDLDNRLVWEDSSVVRGETYRYALVIGPGNHAEGQVQVTVPMPPPLPPAPAPVSYRLNLARVRPNPARRGRACIVSVELPDAAPGALELLDAAGRRAAPPQPVAGPGRFDVPIEGLSHAPPGRYILRLAHGGQQRSRTLIVLP